MAIYSRKDLIARLRADHGYSARSAKSVVDDVLVAIADQVEDLQVGDKLTFVNVGRLECIQRKGRDKAVGFRSKKRAHIGPYQWIRFKPAPQLAASLRSRPAVSDAAHHEED
jgi:nucleoid DNA-binding protein